MDRRAFLEMASVVSLGAGTNGLTATNDVKAWDPEGQRQRREQIHKLHQASVIGQYDDQGSADHSTFTTLRPRECYWSCLSFLKGAGTRAKANKIILATLKQWPRGGAFEVTGPLLLMLEDQGELEPQARDQLMDYLRRLVPLFKNIRFMGYNDNFPAMDSFIAVLGGQLLGNAEAQRQGRAGLETLAALFERRGLLSEYTSPTYGAITLCCLAGIAERCQDSEVARLACQLEQRVWLDVATHFHEPTNVLAGPHARAYCQDCAGHLSNVNVLLYQVFGKRVWMNPLHYLYPPAEGQVLYHYGSAASRQNENVWFASSTYHPSAAIASLLFEKRFPFFVRATAEFGAAAVPLMVPGSGSNAPLVKSTEVFEYPSGETVNTTYMTEDFALGTSTAQFHDGQQSDAFFVNLRRAAPARSLKDIRTIFCRYTSNDHRPGFPVPAPGRPEWPVSADDLPDEGRVRAAQKDGTALVVYQPKNQIVDAFRSLQLTIVVTAFYGRPKRILVGVEEVPDRLPFDVAQPGVIWIEDELVFAAFRPLVLTNYGRKAAIRIEEQRGYITISLYNYEGPAHRFTRKQLCETMNGFVAEFGTRQQYGSLERFQQELADAEVWDEIESASQYNAGQRVTRYTRPSVQLEIAHSIYFDGLKYVLIDGKLQERPMFSAPGVSLG